MIIFVLIPQEPVVKDQYCWSSVLLLAEKNCGGTRKSPFAGYKHPRS